METKNINTEALRKEKEELAHARLYGYLFSGKITLEEYFFLCNKKVIEANKPC